MAVAMLVAWRLDREPRVQSWLKRPTLLLLAAALLRIIPYIGIYLIYGYQAQADLSGAFFRWALAASTRIRAAIALVPLGFADALRDTSRSVLPYVPASFIRPS